MVAEQTSKMIRLDIIRNVEKGGRKAAEREDKEAETM